MLRQVTKCSKTLRAVLLGTTALLVMPAAAQEGTGFSISINGDQVSGDPRVAQTVRRPDVQLAQADVRIQYDGLTVTPVLDLEHSTSQGGAVTLQSALNYPAFVERGEVRLYDGAGRLLRTVPIDPNGQTTITLPEDEVFATHRVYDARGRYDETVPLPLHRTDTRDRVDGVEDGTNATARRGIPVYGGAVTVSGDSVPQGARVQTLGETVRPDRSGSFAIQRILPAGSYPVGVQVQGAGQNIDLVRDIEVPQADWFSVATTDLTYGITDRDGVREDYTTGRVAGYLSGRFANGVELTAQIDTGEGPLDEIFSDLDERDPRSVLLRVDPDDLYPTYGDDSTIVDDTPTSGKFYLRVERENNYLLWGDYRADVDGGYLRNERDLYGLSAHVETRAVTDNGDARASVDVYAASPERLAQRDVLRGTGGAVYFLRRQDIGIGTETITVQTRDAATGRVLGTRELVAGRDYAINYIQGVITLASPLSSYSSGEGLVVTDPGGDTKVSLIAQYEYSPTATDVDTFAYGGRVEAWATDDLRIGVTVMGEDTGAGDQRAAGLDVLWQPSDTAYVALDYARSEGPGFGEAVSTDGGLVFDATVGAGGTGDAVRLEAGADLSDFGMAQPGTVSAYFEERSAGFSTLDYDVTDDVTLWGLALDVEATDRLTFALYYDSYESDSGERDREGGIEASYAVTDAVTLGFGLEHLDRNDGTEDGRRTDAAIRLAYAPSDDAEIYGYVQSTIERSGTLSDNDRYGIGGSYAISHDWTVTGEISDGDQGLGARILFEQDRGASGTTYAGYELEPNREMAGVTLNGSDSGRVVFGGTRDLGQGVSTFGENTYDMFGEHRSLTSAYGLTYEVNDNLTYSSAVEFAQVQDDTDGDYERQGLSFGMSYTSEDLDAAARLEYRRDDGTLSGSARDSETVLLVSDLRYQIDEDRRVLASVDAATTSGDGAIVESGELIDVQLGYAFRPVDNERLNALLRYRYFEDTYGQQLASDDTPGSLQRSHVLSAEASYDLNREWTLGGKVGVRLSETADDASSPFVSNDAALLVANARYHMLHNWDAVLEVRAMHLDASGTTEVGGLGAIYRHLGPNVMLGVGYSYGAVSSDLTDIDEIETGAFINLVTQF